jgi:hypothetical protein
MKVENRIARREGVIKMESPAKTCIKEVFMELKEYFQNQQGLGVLSTADGSGRVNAAVYSRPHFMEDGSLAFIMRDRLSHRNLTSNPHATYLFKEDGPAYTGKRLYLTKVREEENSDLIDSLSRRKYPANQEITESRFLVFFKLDKERPLVGDV